MSEKILHSPNLAEYHTAFQPEQIMLDIYKAILSTGTQ